MPFAGPLQVQRCDSRTWQLLTDLTYRGESDTFRVPTGYRTDFASVPQSLQWLIERTGAYTAAAVVHDWLITEEIPARRVTSRDTDGIFRRIMREEGVHWARRWPMWSAVRVAAVFSPRRAYGRGFARDLPAVAGITVLALPVLPAFTAVLLTRFTLRALLKVLPG